MKYTLYITAVENGCVHLPETYTYVADCTSVSPFLGFNVALFLPRPPPDHPTSVPVVQQVSKGKRGRPRKIDAPRRRNKLRMCIDPNVPVVDRSACRGGG